MRRPTPRFRLYAWHTAALSGRRVPVAEDDPQCGWFRCRMVQGGPWIPAEIWCDQPVDIVTGELVEPETMRATLGGEPADPAKIWLRVSARPISREAYSALVEEHRRNARMAATHAAYDLTDHQPMRPA